MNAQALIDELPRPTAGLDARARVLHGLPVRERRLRLAGIDTAVLEGGDGPPIVLLHGQGEFAAEWSRIIPQLVSTHRVIVPDLPGHGASEVGEEKLDADRVFAWLGELMDSTCGAPPVVAGHLLGGAIAARFAIARPGRFDRLVLVDTLGLAWFRPAPAFAIPMVQFLARPNERTQDRLFRRCMVDLDEIRNQMDGRMELLEAYALECARKPKVQAALKRLMARLGVPRIARADLARIAIPTTLICGRHGLQVRLRIAKAASARYGWPLHVIEDAADDPAVEQPAAFLRALRSALGENTRVPGRSLGVGVSGDSDWRTS